MSVIDIDLKGLVQLTEDQGPGRLITELVRNSLDEDGVTKVEIHLNMESGRPLCRVEVIDDAPSGFADLSHAYTLFAPSYKKKHAEKAGRFNMGDKLFIAAAVITGQPAYIRSTTGSVMFTDAGRTRLRKKTEKGSVVEAYLKMTRDQYHNDVIRLIKRLLVPKDVVVTLNSERLPPRTPVHMFKAKLPTVLEDEEGVLRSRIRETTIRVYSPLEGETPSLYELGIPVVETGDKYHIDIGQCVPLNMQRDNVPPNYLRTVRTLVYNETFTLVTAEEANDSWVREATSDERIVPEAMERALDLRFGKKRVSFDLSDPEANNRAVAEGYTVVHGRMLSGQEWENNRKNELTLPAGRLFPTPKPYSNDPNAPLVDVLPESEWTDGMKKVVKFTKYLHQQVFQCDCNVSIVNTTNAFAACYSRSRLDFNLKNLGHKFFNEFGPLNVKDVVKLLIHEFAHWHSGNHLSEDYHDGLCDVGACLFDLVLKNGFTVDEHISG